MTSEESVNSVDIVTRLRARTAEIEEAILARIRGVDPASPGEGDVQYEASRRAAVTAALGYVFSGIEHGDAHTGMIPSELVAQARQAARIGVELGTIFRRCHAANAELIDFVTQEACNCEVVDGAVTLRRIQQTQAWLLDHLVTMINSEYASEVNRVDGSVEQRQSDRIRRLLAGSPIESTELGYDLDAWHLALIGRGLGVGQALRGTAAGLDSRLLCAAYDGESV